MKKLYAVFAAVLMLFAMLLGPVSAETPQSPITPKLIGMSAPNNLWSTRLAEVGPCGVEARRIFADLVSNGRDQSTIIQQAVSQGMLPVISYKVPNVTTLINGGYDTWLDNTQNYLDSLGVQVVAVFWHEPHGDLSAAQFRAGSQRFLDHVQSEDIAVGPILNGWLLDNQVSTFASYTSPALLGQWDFVGVDTYQDGSIQNPGSKLPGRAVPLLENWLDGQGFGNLPIGVGEYNGFTASALEYAGEVLLSTPEVWFGMVFNSDVGGRGVPLTGDRLEAYQDTKDDPRAKNDCHVTPTPTPTPTVTPTPTPTPTPSPTVEPSCN